MLTPTLAIEASSLPPEAALFAPRGGPWALTVVRGPDDDPIPIGEPDDDDVEGDDDEEEDDDGDYEDE